VSLSDTLPTRPLVPHELDAIEHHESVRKVFARTADLTLRSEEAAEIVGATVAIQITVALESGRIVPVTLSVSDDPDPEITWIQLESVGSVSDAEAVLDEHDPAKISDRLPESVLSDMAEAILSRRGSE